MIHRTAGEGEAISLTPHYHKPAVYCLIEILSCIVDVVGFWEKLPKSECLTCKSYPPMVEAVQALLAVAKLKFFSSLESHFWPFFSSFIKLTTQWHHFMVFSKHFCLPPFLSWKIEFSCH